MEIKHTPGPWRWELNEKHRQLQLVGGKPTYDLTIIRPDRWGMQGATLEIRDTAHDGMNIMHKLHARRDWIAPHEGRAHHAGWCANVIHPDMRLIAAAPDLLAALQAIIGACDRSGGDDDKSLIDEFTGEMEEAARAAIAKATGAA
jgi:hypothetical protein